MHLVKTDSENKDFKDLVSQLDAYLTIVDGDEHDFYHQYNSIDALKNTIVAYIDNKPVGCGAFKAVDRNTVEVKRMFTRPETRNLGLATKILKGLEDWAKELGYKKCILETGKRQIEAVQFYKKNKYQVIPNYGQYATIENSICFNKALI
ncbi:GNAT family N-acetyltransferase [Algibacter amylolyticus]|uniref:GNAT family N-acetyltransferase n=1 Tax=Algibacter amylolyticus TaxID=1608400 RepID=A0A5M7B4E2_9FLAO|nr:GNAT family N-acetyltransferase [Algibacter amylolyticus]KAA5824423.1 GNAT family N-acetyltransferase [Algibacter amylolyticus]MBB5269519.1 GNAT superfamily N-acetyltransferase [Algibacter amylolyticus]TSJ75196.1 GNAT family N-acetyltransferase [Algibacter amylolyticus]